jgi:hypothetical protein
VENYSAQAFRFKMEQPEDSYEDQEHPGKIPMTYFEAIRDGIRLVNKNWQLVLIQLSMVFVSSIGFFIIVGIPLAIAFIIFGIDLTELANMKDLFRVLREPSDILSKYLGIFLIILSSFLLYITLVALLGIYIFGGAIGVIGNSIRERSSRFTAHLFFSEAKKLFLRLLGFTSVIGVLFIIAAFLLGVLGGGIAALVSFAQSQDSTLALFFGTFFSLILIAIAVVLILGILSLTLYGIASLSFKGTGPLDSIKAATRYMFGHPEAFWLYAILFAGYLLASFLLILLSYPFTLIPIIGAILSFPYQLISYAFETYLGLTIIATILTYYSSTECPVRPIEPVEENLMAQPPQPSESEEKPAPDTDANNASI